MKKASNIFAHTDCLSEDMLAKYISGKLSPAQKHEVEKHLIDCEMCSDAVDGLNRVAEKNKIASITSELNQKIRNRAGKKEGKVIFLQHYRTQLAVAASVVVLLGLVWFFRSNMSMKELDSVSSEKIFADKFEPYPVAEKDVSANESVSESPELNKPAVQIAIGAKGEPIHITNDVEKDKKVAAKGLDFSDKLSKESTKSAEGGYRATLTVKKNTANSIPAEADVLREESLALEQEEKKLQQKGAEKDAFTISGGNVTREEFQAVPSKNINSVASTTAGESRQDEGDRLSIRGSRAEDSDVQSKKEGKKGDISKRKKSEVNQRNLESGSTITTPVVTTQAVISDSVIVSKTRADAEIAMQKYDNKDYSGAVIEFEKILAKDPDHYNALFYSAVSYLSTGETDKALTNLNKVREKKDGEFYDAAQWYLSLTYIKKNDTQNARKNLMELKKNSKSKYQKQADETLKEMQK